MTGLLRKRRKLDTDTHTHTENHLKMKTKIGLMHPQAKGCQGLPASHQKLGEKQNRFSLTAFRRNQIFQCLDLGPPASRMMRQWISVTISHPVFGTLLQHPYKNNYN